MKKIFKALANLTALLAVSLMTYNCPTMNENLISMGVDELEIKHMLTELSSS